MSGKYSSDDIDGLRVLAKNHELSKSLQAIKNYSPFIQPEGLSGRVFNNNHTNVEACSSINRLDIPENLQHFSQLPSEIDEEQNSWYVPTGLFSKFRRKENMKKDTHFF